MVNRWPEHHTFSVELPDHIDFLVVADILLAKMREANSNAVIRFDGERLGDVMAIEAHDEQGDETESVKLTSFQVEETIEHPRYYGRNHGEGRLTPASRAALQSVLGMTGGVLTTRGRHGADPEKVTFDASSGPEHELSPFFSAIRELEKVTPLGAACEIAKCAEIEEERLVLLRVLSAFGPK